jgi:RNA-directed DNA polymerase
LGGAVGQNRPIELSTDPESGHIGPVDIAPPEDNNPSASTCEPYRTRLLLNGKLGIAPKSIQRAKERIRQITGRNRGVSLALAIVELNLFLIGWLTYYRYAACRFALECLDKWIRRKLRCYRLTQRKRGRSIATFLRRLGVSPLPASKLARSGKGPWRLTNTRQVKAAML